MRINVANNNETTLACQYVDGELTAIGVIDHTNDVHYQVSHENFDAFIANQYTDKIKLMMCDIINNRSTISEPGKMLSILNNHTQRRPEYDHERTYAMAAYLAEPKLFYVLYGNDVYRTVTFMDKHLNVHCVYSKADGQITLPEAENMWRPDIAIPLLMGRIEKCNGKTVLLPADTNQ